MFDAITILLNPVTPGTNTHRPPLRRIRGTLTLVLALTACGSPGPKIEPAPAGRLEFSGFSVAPPPGEGWEMQRAADGVMFRKESGSPQHTLVAVVSRSTGFDPAVVGFAAYATDREVFAKYVHAAMEHTDREVGNPPRFRTLTEEVIPDDRYGYCARTYQRSEDHGAAASPLMMILENWGYTCLMPTAANVIVQVGFSERALPGQSDDTVAATRDTFFDGFRFTTPVVVAPMQTVATPLATSAPSPTGGTTADNGPALLMLILDPALREDVATTLRESTPPPEFVFEGDARTGEPHRTLQLAFASVVDRGSQQRNRDGAAIGGIFSVLVGSITPWTCGVTHSVRANLTAADGELLHSWEVVQKDKHVGTMLMCPDVDRPEKGAVRNLVGELLQRMRADRLLEP